MRQVDICGQIAMDSGKRKGSIGHYHLEVYPTLRPNQNVANEDICFDFISA